MFMKNVLTHPFSWSSPISSAIACCLVVSCTTHSLNTQVFEGIPANAEKVEDVDGHRIVVIEKVEQEPWHYYLYKKRIGGVRNEFGLANMCFSARPTLLTFRSTQEKCRAGLHTLGLLDTAPRLHAV